MNMLSRFHPSSQQADNLKQRVITTERNKHV